MPLGGLLALLLELRQQGWETEIILLERIIVKFGKLLEIDFSQGHWIESALDTAISISIPSDMAFNKKTAPHTLVRSGLVWIIFRYYGTRSMLNVCWGVPASVHCWSGALLAVLPLATSQHWPSSLKKNLKVPSVFGMMRIRWPPVLFGS